MYSHEKAPKKLVIIELPLLKSSNNIKNPEVHYKHRYKCKSVEM